MVVSLIKLGNFRVELSPEQRDPPRYAEYFGYGLQCSALPRCLSSKEATSSAQIINGIIMVSCLSGPSEKIKKHLGCLPYL